MPMPWALPYAMRLPQFHPRPVVGMMPIGIMPFAPEQQTQTRKRRVGERGIDNPNKPPRRRRCSVCLKLGREAEAAHCPGRGNGGKKNCMNLHLLNNEKDT
jgi:hypothetical protein